MPQSSTVPRDRLLTRYRDRRSRRLREVISIDHADATMVLIDRDAYSGGDCRLLAHLGPEEPPRNAALVCADYLQRLGREPLACRRLRTSDLHLDLNRDPADAALADGPAIGSHMPGDVAERFQLHPQSAARKPTQLRWWSCNACGPLHPVSLRDAIASLESYEPIRAMSEAACRETFPANGCNPISVTVLRAELKRVLASPIVLNRALREAVLECLARGDVSMSEIATRCGRVKLDANGNESGETSWLGRRLGLLPEGGKSSPTPWIHSDVLALIARSGLGIAPREVEL